MYTPKHFAENDIYILHDLIRNHNFAILFSGDTATHLPFMIDSERGEYGTLIAHFARANSHWQQLSADDNVLVVFQGAHTYISPTWYPSASLIPTWNYAVVHAYGKPKLIHDPERLRQMLLDLVEFHEGNLFENMSEAFSNNRLEAIVGFEIPIERIEGKFKFNQNKSHQDQQGVISALENSSDSNQRAVAEIMKKNLARKSV
jgi:transcriptional regulator